MKTPLHLCLERSFPLDAAGKAVVRMAVADVEALLSDEALQAEAMTQLSPQRRAKAAACGHPRSRALSLGAGLLLDTLLAAAGQRERDMTYADGEHGKPAFATGTAVDAWTFNLSHSWRMVAAVLHAPATPPSVAALSVAVGIDVQRITLYRPELVRRVFSAADRQRLAEAPDEAARQRLFALLWCRAEAYAKATGAGLQWPFPTPCAGAVFHDFAVGDDYCGALCVLDSESVKHKVCSIN